MKLEPPTPKIGLEETLALTPPSRAEANPVILSRIATAGEGPALSPRRERPELCARLAPLNQPTAPSPRPSPPPRGRGCPKGGRGGGSWAGGSTRSSRNFHALWCWNCFMGTHVGCYKARAFSQRAYRNTEL